MDDTISRLIFRESGGFTGLQRGCTVEAAALPAAPRGELQSLLQEPSLAQGGAVPDMPDMQVYTLELVMRPDSRAVGEPDTPVKPPKHRVLRYPASDVPEDLSELIGYLRDLARPLDPR